MTAADASDSPVRSPGDARSGRLRLADLETEHRPDARVRIAVELEASGRRFRGEAEGVGTGAVELRLAASAALEAVRRAAPDETEDLRLVGTKAVRAFDADLVLTGLRFQGERGDRLVGAVPAEGDPDRAAAAAVLDAVNRVLDQP